MGKVLTEGLLKFITKTPHHLEIIWGTQHYHIPIIDSLVC